MRLGLLWDDGDNDLARVTPFRDTGLPIVALSSRFACACSGASSTVAVMWSDECALWRGWRLMAGVGGGRGYIVKVSKDRAASVLIATAESDTAVGCDAWERWLMGDGCREKNRGGLVAAQHSGPPKKTELKDRAARA